MLRNVVVAISSLALVAALYWGYTQVVELPEVDQAAPDVESLPREPDRLSAPLTFGPGVEVPGGRRIVYRRYDERTGRPSDLFSCRDWQPLPGGDNRVRVSEPEIALRLPSGMIATVLAASGELSGDGASQTEMRPAYGSLEGDVRIIIDRATAEGRTPRDARPEDLITISTPRLDFDLERGELRTSERLQIESDEFSVAAVGLNLVWNEADNQVERLTVERGEEFVFYAPAGLLDAAAPREPTPATAPAAETKPAKARTPRDRAPAAYTCVLDGDVVAEQVRHGQRAASLSADELSLLFDVGARADRAIRPQASTAPATGPSSRPARDRGNCFQLRWSGRLRLAPAAPSDPNHPSRLHVVAVGAPVVLTRGSGQILAGRVEYHDETQRVWLDPPSGTPLTLAMGERLSADAAGVYVDRVARTVKLVGPLELRSRGAGGAGPGRSSIRAALWCELRLAARERAAAADELDVFAGTDAIESARFMGDVHVGLSGQTLTAGRVDAVFREAPVINGASTAAAAGSPGQEPEPEALESQLESVVASSAARLISEDGALHADRINLAFDNTDMGELYPTALNARGGVQLRRAEARLSGERVAATFAAAAADRPKGAPAFVIQSLDVFENAELIDPKSRVAASGDGIVAAFSGDNDLTTAEVRGSGARPARLYAEPYNVRGEIIALDRAAQRLDVDGASRLSFRATRSIQGFQRGSAARVVVTAQRSLRIDGRANKAEFAGEVVARSDAETLAADTLTLLLEDVIEPTAATAPARGGWEGFLRAGGEVLGLSGDDADRERRFDLAADMPENVRKEPARLIAQHALVTSETFRSGEDSPIVHASISAPTLEVDVARREITTTGRTQLLMVDRRAASASDASASSDALGLPSALVGRGPSQTAMQCMGRMVYTLGPDGPARRDVARFERDVFFVHRTGAEMVGLRDALPAAAADPKSLESANSRNVSMECERLECNFVVDAAGDEASRGGALTRTPMRLTAMTATDDVYLRDQQGPKIRELNAAWVDFDRTASRIIVRGGPAGDARVYLQNTQTQQFDQHAGREFTIDLKDGTLRSDSVAGEVRRP